MTRISIQQGLGLLLLQFSLLCTPAVAQPQITFSCWLSPDTPIFSVLEDLYRAAFAPLGYRFAMHHQPAQRALMEAYTGQTDGECLRPANILAGAENSTLLRVEAVIANADLEAWTYHKNLLIDSIEDLKQPHYRIGFLRGTDSIGELMSQHQLHHAEPVVSTRVGLKMLSAQRLDFYIDPGALIQLEAAQLTLSNPVYRAGVLLKMQGHAYLHKRHQGLVERFAAQLLQRLPEGGLVP